MPTVATEGIAFVWGPTPLGAEGESSGFGALGKAVLEGGVSFVVIEGDPCGDLIVSVEGSLEVGVDGDFGDLGGEGLFEAEAEAVAPFVGGPKAAAGVRGLASFGFKKVDAPDAEAGGFEEDFAGAVGTGQADEEMDGKGRRWIFGSDNLKGDAAVGG